MFVYSCIYLLICTFLFVFSFILHYLFVFIHSPKYSFDFLKFLSCFIVLLCIHRFFSSFSYNIMEVAGTPILLFYMTILNKHFLTTFKVLSVSSCLLACNSLTSGLPNSPDFNWNSPMDYSFNCSLVNRVHSDIHCLELHESNQIVLE